MFFATLFIIAETRNQPKCPRTEKLIEKKCGIYMCVYIYICYGIQLSHKKREKGDTLEFDRRRINMKIYC